MNSTLEKELTAAGYTPEPVPIDGVVAWTGWHAPVQKDTYEVYYDLICGAMYDHIDSPPWAMLASPRDLCHDSSGNERSPHKRRVEWAKAWCPADA